MLFSVSMPKIVSSAVSLRGLRMGALALVAAATLAGCQDSGDLRSSRANQPIPAETLALMDKAGTTKHAPVLLRAFKKEAELEVWKMRADGAYAHLKTYPMCRWSGQLGPKTREGDRQVPEGFYTITPGQMNPNSQYYLAFNVGYPNAYDKARGYTGGAIMVHGACSSSGCFSMTDEQMAEIYAITREAFSGGQRGIQMQSMPFRMNAENLAKHRLDPHMKFWREIKEGADHFEVTKREPQVAFCGRRYVFNAASANGSRLEAEAACPPLREDDQLKASVAQLRQTQDAKVAELVASGVAPVKIKYADGGQHPTFSHVTMVSRPDALSTGPVEIALEDKSKPAAVRVAFKAAEAARKAAPAVATPAPVAVAAKATQPAAPGVTRVGATASSAPAPVEQAAAYAPQPAPRPEPKADAPFYKRWLGAGATTAAAPVAADAPVAAPAAPAVTTSAPAVPPRRANGNAVPASRDVKVVDPRQRTSSALPAMIRGAQPVLPTGLSAYAALLR